MSISRKRFIGLTLKSAFLIGAGNTLQSFTGNRIDLPPKDKVLLRFAIASDGHYGQPDTQYVQHHQEMIGWLNKEHQVRGVDFTMINGDLIHDDARFLPEVKKVYDQLKTPFFVSHGNHDKTDEATWQQTWNMQTHHAFEKKGVAFMILNTADDSGKYICPDMEWTRQRLNSFAASKHLFVFMHITPVKWTDNAVACPELVTLFNEQSNLKAIFHGHDHDQDGVKENSGKHYFFDSHIAGSWGTAYRGYRIVEVLKNGNILTYQMNPVDKVHINSNSL